MSDSRQSFLQWKNNFLNNYIEFVKNDSNINNLISLFQEIKDSGKIRDSFGKDTKTFIETFIFPLINIILNTRYEQYTNFPQIINLLESISNFYAFLFKSSYDKFLTDALVLYTYTQAPVYTTSNTTGQNYSELYARVLKPISVPEFCEVIKVVIAQNVTYEKINLILNIENLLKTTGIYHVYINEVLKYLLPALITKTGNSQNILLDTPDFRIIDEIYTKLCDFATEDDQKGQILLSCVNINVLFIKSTNPEEQLRGFNMIMRVTKQISQNNIQYVSDSVDRTGVIGELCANCHPDVIVTFAQFIEMIAPVYRIPIEKCNKLWAQTVNAPLNVMFKYVQAWKIIVNIYQQSIRNYLFDAISNGKKYPYPIINFLIKISATATENNKKTLFDDILAASFSCLPEQEEIYFQLVVAYLPKDQEMRRGVQRQVADQIKQTKNVDLGMRILTELLGSANDEVLHAIISSVIPFLQVKHLPFFSRILNALKGKVTDEEFTQFSDVMEIIAKSDMYNLEQFFMSFNATTSNPFQSLHKVSIIRSLCNFGHRLPNTNLVHQLYSGLLINDRPMFLDIIWESYFKSNSPSFMKYLVDLHSEAPESIQGFVEKCFTNIENVASLNILLKLIHEVEDGVDRKAMKYIPLNEYLPDDEMSFVDLILSENTYRIIVPISLSLYAFKLRVSSLVQLNPYSFTLISQKGNASVENFSLKEDKIFEIKVYNVMDYKPFIPKYFPSQIINQEKYTSQLYNVLCKDDNEQSPVSLKILNLLPTLESQNNLLRNANTPQSWASFFSSKIRNLMIYRLNTIGSIISGNHEEWIDYFFKTGGVQVLLGIVIFMSKKLFSNDEIGLSQFSYLLNVVKLIVNTKKWEDYKKEMWSAFDNNALSNLIQICLSNLTNDKIISPLMTIVRNFDIEQMKQIQSFIDLFNSTIFHPNKTVRNEISNLISTLPPPTQARLLMPLLSFTVNKPSDAFFERLTPITEVVENPQPLWDPCISILKEYYQSTIQDRRNVKPEFAQRVFVILDKLSNKFEKVPNANELFTFLVDSVLFNGFNFYEPSSEVISLIIKLFRQNNELIVTISNKIEEIEKIVMEIPKEKPFMKPTTTPENCYIVNVNNRCDFLSSILQLLKNIPQFVNLFLSREYTDKALKDLQLILGQLSFTPLQFVNPIQFCLDWKSDDGFDILSGSLNDAPEFYRRLVRSILSVDVGLTPVLRGEIRRKLSCEEETEFTDRFYSLLPVSISNTDDMEIAIKNYLSEKTVSTDKFGGNVKPAIQVDKISKPSKLLVVQLQRFTKNDQGFKEKNNKEVKFPLKIDISKYMEGNNSNNNNSVDLLGLSNNSNNSVDLLGLGNSNSNSDTVYELRGVLAHKGYQFEGHYISYVKKYEDNKWYIYDDSNVFEISEERMIKDCTGGNDICNGYGNLTHVVNYFPCQKEISGYMFFYSQVNWQNENLSMSETVKNELIKSTKENIYKDICSSSEYSRLILSCSDVDIDGKFLYKSIESLCNNENVTESKISPLIDRFVQLIYSRPELANSIIENVDQIDKYVLNGITAVARKSFATIFIQSLERSSPEKRKHFEQNILQRIPNLSPYFKVFDDFWRIISKIVSIDFDIGENIFKTILDFVCLTLPSFATNYSRESVISIVNVDTIFEILSSINISNENKQSFSHEVINKQFIDIYIKPRNHSKSFCKFISSFIGSDKNLAILLTNVFYSDMNITALTCSSYLVLSLFIDKSISKSFCSSIVSAIELKGSNSKIEIISEIIERIRYYKEDFSDSFINLSQMILQTFIMCKSENVRSLVESLLGTVFPFIFSKDELSDLERQHLTDLFLSLHSMLPDITTTFRKLRESYYYREIKREQFNSYSPCVHYFNLIKLIVVRGHMNTAMFECGNSFIDTLSVITQERIVPNYSLESEFDLLQSSIVDGTEFFSKNSFTKFIRCFPIVKGHFNDQQILQLLRIVPNTTRGTEKIANSDCFKSICKDFMSNEVRTFVEQRLTVDNAKLFAKGMWNIDVIESQIKRKNADYFILSWELLSKDPNTSSIFYSKENICSFYSGVNKVDNPNMRPVMKLFAAFNHAYYQVNKGKKRLGFDKVNIVLDCYFKTAKVNTKQLINCMQIYYPDNFASGGIPDFLRSLCIMSNDIRNHIFNEVIGLDKPLFDVYIPDECIFIARFLVELCSPEYGNSGPSQVLLARELGSLAKVQYPVGEALEIMAQRYWRTETDTGEGNDDMIKFACDMLVRNCSCVESISGTCRILEVKYSKSLGEDKVKTWLDKVYKQASICIARALVVDSNSPDISMFYACIDFSTELHDKLPDIELPKLAVDRNEILYSKANSKNEDKLTFLDRVIQIIGI
ncbi:Clan CA, family C19, ubiquitin hydrolase-like cysteine peptidase [Trichomonas vaginalis G3]|uniref:Clan CA, family C19, ubiquitin hydrolase-like cysteine peptidase n=1 Tax=Trichomonas vaginalis (strain ATCC PRA-98 / G3) TaxID=412133 RepID=A2EDA7_TRIV3|nr:ubiquitinyl hydrolase protein [Trichomonas vaginalis G3]EAY09365.1 Clan CA, family C19, ubiquitin hydrolase-like cysteine peptidase [Trichomonas vaginalis G3]KAI5501699.1 ubiquitinyl hydrolase protein [Trichomonas vaginalis G3]|eukprot:XP_001321588.1 Clan CA, family C19, ubiquitin hydrolase-like cysteine peptidase [Trichomonas vaginalis G3]